MNCIPKEKMEAILKDIQSTKDDVLGLVKMSLEEKTAFFAKHIGKDATSMANSLERAIISKRKRALGDFFRNNFDYEQTVKNLNTNQKKAIEKFVLDKLLPVSKKSPTISGSQVMKMSEKERSDFIKNHFSSEKVAELEKKFKDIEVLEKNTRNIAEIARMQREAGRLITRETKKLEKYISKYLEGKVPSKKEPSIPARKIADMPEKERLAYLKKVGVENPEKMNDRLTKAKAAYEIAKFDRALAKKEAGILSLQKKNIEKYIDRNTFTVEKGGKDLGFRKRMSKPVDEILSMTEPERVKYLSDYFKNPEEVSLQMKTVTRSVFEKQLEIDMKKFTNMSEVDAYMRGKLDSITNEKGKNVITTAQVEEIQKKCIEIEELRAKSEKSGLASDRQELGLKIIELSRYEEGLMPKASWKEHAISISEIPRMATTTGELSGMGIQGRAHLLRFLYDKQIWGIAKRSLKIAFSQEEADKYMADLITRDSYKAMKESGIRITLNVGKLSQREEGFASNLFKVMEKSKLPVIHQIGAVGEGFSRQYAAYLTMLRTEGFQNMYDGLRTVGATKEDFKELGRSINDATGSASMGLLEKGDAMSAVNAILFSFRKIMADIRMRTVRPVKDTYRLATGTKAQKMIALEGLKRFASNLALSGAVFGVTKLLQANGADTEVITSPTSSNFGNPRIGNQVIETDSGDWITILTSRIFSDGYTDSTGIFKEYSNDPGGVSKIGMVAQTLRYKLSPNLAFAIDMLAGENAVGEKFMKGATKQDIIDAMNGDEGALALIKGGAQREAFNRLVPMYWQTLAENLSIFPMEMQTLVNNGQQFPYVVPGVFGFQNKPVYYGINFEDSDSKKIKQFNDFIGVDKIAEAEGKYNERVYNRIQSKKKEQSFKDKSNDDKQKEITKIKEEEKTKLFNEYKFVYIKK